MEYGSSPLIFRGCGIVAVSLVVSGLVGLFLAHGLDLVHDGSAYGDLVVSSQDEVHHLLVVQDAWVWNFRLSLGEVGDSSLFDLMSYLDR